MATIEPRLIHLLNESTATPRPHHAELPPLKGLTLPKSSPGSGRPHPIEPDAGRRPDASESNGTQLTTQARASLFSNNDDGTTGSSARKESSYVTDRTLLNHISSQDLRMILDDTPESVADDLANKKRPSKEDFVQLPQPLKKQKAAAQQQHAFPPIIVGLLEPPLNAALFPPITSGSFDDRPHSDPSQAPAVSKSAPETQPAAEEKTPPSPSAESERTQAGKPKRKAAKPRRKWSEEETNHLLLGVSKHGVGRWTDILEDNDYSFHGRSAGDLKDRFRTCCPEELRTDLLTRKAAGVIDKEITAITTSSKPKKGLMSENILNKPEEQVEIEQSTQNDSDSAPPKQRKSRAHRKKMEDLVELGIKGPFKKSHRRERRPFSEQDDREILEGFELYGPQWTKIQRDPRFNLSSRQPTDLRDRLRNKYPEKFTGNEKTTLHVKEQSGQANFLEPSVTMAIENSLHVSRTALLEPQLNRTHSREDMPRWPLQASLLESNDYSQSNGSGIWNDSTVAGLGPGVIGEMDISRLLLDDSQGPSEASAAERRGLG